ncbi:sensor histidine kinase [Frisingicoccus sp.]|uniref:sensor histidine kinase n=1 Tax=Frisingicoccus sp. TaxID=1918627 RepID=UPI002A8274ED|nr:HAMP domain-containing sensor histidine kinase [Frisingicoccus sp.]MDY4921827.1 HAMP domain-containing sensor histidine kinase [Frisingicoccus sp.]
MDTGVLCWILGAGLCIAVLILLLWMGWFFSQWKKLEEILFHFQSGMTDRVSDVEETRESRLVSELGQILRRASLAEKKAQQEKNEVMALISDLSHQLKTPLANIILDTELMEQGNLDDRQQKEFIRHTRAQALKMQWLMQNLLKASRLENGIIRFQAENTGIKQTIARSVSAVYAQASRKNIEIRIEDFQDVTLFHNPKWTSEAIANVLENAVKYSPENSRIEIRIRRQDLYTGLMISDQGMGIPETEYNKIFQRFYRGKQVQNEEGTGLGLYLAQLILQSEQGYMTVSSRKGQGSTFSIYLLNYGSSESRE